ncbi:MAG: hypothetical protein RBR86_06300 [Pseudobdellovibrionaceae bacterium]|jgi:hypothetical protein|nr:hypothetical protein [Pseudobdellovibrionaceae bacterium]
MKKVLAVVLTFVLGGGAGIGIGVHAKPAQAEEQLLNLWPTQRSLHDREMDITAKKYQDRGQEYVDQLYSSHGEKYLPETLGIHDELNLPPMIEPEPVDVNEVAEMINGMNSSQSLGQVYPDAPSPNSAPVSPVANKKPTKTPFAGVAQALRDEREKAEQLKMMQAEAAKTAE